MCVCEFLVAIVGVTVGSSGSVEAGTINLPAQRVLIAFVYVVPSLDPFPLLRSSDLNSWQPSSCSCFFPLFSCVYIAAFAATWGPIAWVVTGELFPLAIRGKAMSLAVASNWLWNFAIGYATPYLVNPTTTGLNGVKAANLGVKVFFIWGACCLGCFLFTYFLVSLPSPSPSLPLLSFSSLIKLTSFISSLSFTPFAL
jgi:SP family sugar:H+ symporter-like MFS transporter